MSVRVHCALAFVFSASATLSGCTVIGLGTGIVVDAASERKYEKQAPELAARIERGETVVLHARNGVRVEGTFVDVAQPDVSEPDVYLLVRSDSRTVLVRQSELRDIAVEQPKRAWLYGGAIGLGVDAVIVALFAAFYRPSFNLSQDSSGGGGW